MCSNHQSFRICGYTKTQHFLQRQSEREVPDHVLRHFLKGAVAYHRYFWIVVGNGLLKKWIARSGSRCLTQHNLIIVADGDKLVTCYFGKIIHSEFPKNHQLIIIQNETFEHS